MEEGQVNEEKPSQEEWPLEKAEVGAKEILVTSFLKVGGICSLDAARWLQRKGVCNMI